MKHCATRTALALTLVLTMSAGAGCSKDDGTSPPSPVDESPDAGAPINEVATTVPWVDEMGDSAAYDSVTGTIHAAGCLTPSTDDQWARDSSQFQQVTTFELVEDKMSLYDKLSVSYSTALNAKYYKNSAEYHMTNDLKIDTHSVWALLRIAIKGPTIKRTTLKMNSRYYSQAAPDMAAFRSSCGDQFLYRVQTGATYYALLRISVKNLQERNSLSVKLKESVGTGSVNFTSKQQFENQFGLTQGSTQISSFVSKTGALTTRVVDDVSVLMADAQDWLQQVSAEFQCTRAAGGTVWTGSYNCPNWQGHLTELRTQFANKGSFLPYTASVVDWGTTPSSKLPPLAGGLASLGELGASFARHLIVKDALSSVLEAPEYYLASRNPLVYFGRVDATGRFPMLQGPASLPYAVAPPAQLQAVQTMAAAIDDSIAGLKLIAQICTEDDSAGAPPVTAEAMCSTACQDPAMVTRYGGTVDECLRQCRGLKVCEIAYALYAADSALKVIELKANLFNKPDGMPSGFSYRTPGTQPWQAFALPSQRDRTPIDCSDYAAEAGGQVLADGEYLVYFGGAPDRPFYVYCDGMSGRTPTAFLSLPHTTPAASRGTDPGGPVQTDGLANFSSSDAGSAATFSARHYTKMAVLQEQGQVFLRPNLKYSEAFKTNELFCEATSRQGAYAGYFDIDLRGLPLEINHGQQFLGGGRSTNSPIYVWAFTRISLDSDPAPLHANRVAQKLRVVIAGINARGYTIDYTGDEDNATLNDGKHELSQNHPPGYLRLGYVDAPAQAKAANHPLIWLQRTTEINSSSTTPVHRITSFRNVTF